MKRFIMIIALLFAGAVVLSAQSKQVFRYTSDDLPLIVDVSDYESYIFISTSTGVSGYLQQLPSYDGSLMYYDSIGDCVSFINNAQIMIFGDYNTKQYITLHFVTTYFVQP